MSKTLEELKKTAIQIRDELKDKQNSAFRIGTQLLEQIENLESDYYKKTDVDKEVQDSEARTNKTLAKMDTKITDLETGIQHGLKVDTYHAAGGGSRSIVRAFSEEEKNRKYLYFYVDTPNKSQNDRSFLYFRNAAHENISTLSVNNNTLYEFEMPVGVVDIKVFYYTPTAGDYNISSVVSDEYSNLIFPSIVECEKDIEAMKGVKLAFGKIEKSSSLVTKGIAVANKQKHTVMRLSVISDDGNDGVAELRQVMNDESHVYFREEILLNKENLIEVKDDNVNKFIIELSSKIPNGTYNFELSNAGIGSSDIYEINKGVTSLQNDLSRIGNSVNLERKFAFGSKVTGRDMIKDYRLQLFTKVDSYIHCIGGGNAAYLKDGAYSAGKDRFTVNVNGGVIQLSGDCKINGARDLNKSLVLGKGRYYIQSQSDDAVVENGIIYMKMSYNWADITNKGMMIDLKESTSIDFYVYSVKWSSAPQVSIKGQLDIRLLILKMNSGESLEYPQPWKYADSSLMDVTFSTDKRTNIFVNDKEFTLPFNVKYPLRAIKVNPTQVGDSTGGMRRVEEFATYSDSVGNCYVSDSFEFTENGVTYIQRVGVIESYDPDSPSHKKLIADTRMPNGRYKYVTNDYNGLVRGCKVYYALKPTDYSTTDITSLFLYLKIVKDTQVRSDNPGVYFYLDYMGEAVQIKKSSSVIRLGNVGDVAFYSSASCIDGTCAYAGSSGGDIAKIDISNPFFPRVVSKLRISSQKLYDVGWVRSITADDSYIYVICRLLAPALTHEPVRGTLTIVDKETFKEIAHIKLENKGTGGAIFEGNLYCMEQICDFQVFSLAAIKKTILEGNTGLINVEPLFQLNMGSWQSKLGEYQAVDFWEAGGRKYCATSAFDKGVNFFDITDVNLGTPYCIKRLGGLRLDFRKEDEIGQMQVFDLVVKYPYVYASISVAMQEVKFSKTAHRGILRLNISDLAKYTKPSEGDSLDTYGSVGAMSFAELIEKGDDDIFDFGDIPYIHQSDHYKEGDPHPSRVERIGDILITNDGKQGIAIYKIKDDGVVFDKTISIGDTTQSLCATKDMLGVATERTEEFGLYKISNIDF